MIVALFIGIYGQRAWRDCGSANRSCRGMQLATECIVITEFDVVRLRVRISSRPNRLKVSLA